MRLSLLDDDLTSHLRMKRTVVLVRARRSELSREPIAVFQSFRVETFVSRGRRMRLVVAIDPCDFFPNLDRQRRWFKCKVLNHDLIPIRVGVRASAVCSESHDD